MDQIKCRGCNWQHRNNWEWIWGKRGEEQLLIMRRHRKNPGGGGNLRAQMLLEGFAKIAKASLQGTLLSRATAGMEYKMQLSRAGGEDFWSWASSQQRKNLGENSWAAVPGAWVGSRLESRSTWTHQSRVERDRKRVQGIKLKESEEFKGATKKRGIKPL